MWVEQVKATDWSGNAPLYVRYLECLAHIFPDGNDDIHYEGMIQEVLLANKEGVNVPESVKSYAQKQGFHVLQYRGDRFDIANSKSAFVPEE